MLQVATSSDSTRRWVALAKLNLTPKFLDAVRVSPLPFRSLDVGVVLDVMIHDIDIILSLVNRRCNRFSAVGASVIAALRMSATRADV